MGWGMWDWEDWGMGMGDGKRRLKQDLGQKMDKSHAPVILPVSFPTVVRKSRAIIVKYNIK